MPLQVLIVDDEPAIAETLEYVLRASGFVTSHVTRGHDAIRRVEAGQVDFVILDVGLPDLDGFEVCKEIRRRSSIPVLFLTARGDEIDRVVGLEIGADDYVVKPFSPREVVSRVKAIWKRTGGATEPQPEAEPARTERTRWFVVDEYRATVTFFGAPLALTRSEYLILRGMLARPERVHSRAELLAFASASPGTSLERTADAHVKALRAKLRARRPDVDPIETHRGLGYSIKNGPP